MHIFNRYTKLKNLAPSYISAFPDGASPVLDLPEGGHSVYEDLMDLQDMLERNPLDTSRIIRCIRQYLVYWPTRIWNSVLKAKHLAPPKLTPLWEKGVITSTKWTPLPPRQKLS
jgi:hypothetical protein